MGTTDGYVQEIDYTHGYCAELAPSILDLACLSRGLGGLPADRPPKYLELAFGQGVSVNIHAAACAGEFWGIDFNPAHAGNARDLAQASGAGAQVYPDSFETFAARDDVPQFDVIALHGTWSWISAENRHLVVEILRRRLAPGGICFVSYNCMPGWAAEVPLRHLLVQHAGLPEARVRTLAERIDACLAFARSMPGAGAGFFRAHPGLDAWLANMDSRSRHYLAHEYFNRDWHPMSSADVAQALSAAQLTYAAPATLSDHIAGRGLPPAAQDFLRGIAHPGFRETVFDYLSNQRFRRDVFTRGAPALSGDARAERLRSLPFVLVQHPAHVPTRVATSGGEVELPPQIYGPLTAALAEDGFAPKTLRQLEAHPGCAAIGFEPLVEAALMLTGIGSLHPAQSPSAIAAAEPRCRALNARLLERAALADNVPALASPVLGAGVYADRREMLFLRAISLGAASEAEWARHAWQCLGADSEARFAGLAADASAFARIRLPLLRALRVA
jgi:SAM-dependent methyltransferase